MTDESRKRSVAVNAGLLASLAWSLSGCNIDDNAHLDDARRCVNDQNIVVDQSNCDDTRGAGIGHWYYGGYGYTPGGTASGGSVQPPKGSTYSDGGSVSRGGIGGTGGGGGHGGSSGS